MKSQIPDNFQTFMPFKNLDNDCAFEILSFCSPRDLSSFTSTSRSSLNLQSSKLLWARFCVQKWNLLSHEEDIVAEIITTANMDLRNLYHDAWPQSISLSSNDEDINCRGTIATFAGVIGQGYRSVQSGTCFPPIPEDHAIMWLRDYFCHLFLKRSFFGSMRASMTCFSTPFKDILLPSKYIITPRDIAYYEVRILRNEVRRSTSFMSLHLHNNDESNMTDCVAVGLATHGFFLQKRLPGWDNDRYSRIHTYFIILFVIGLIIKLYL